MQTHLKKRIKSLPFPEWFSIKNYDQLETLTVEELLNELATRLYLLDEILELDDVEYSAPYFPPYPEWELIAAGNPVTGRIPKTLHHDCPVCLPRCGGIEPLFEGNLLPTTSECSTCDLPTIDIHDGVTDGNVALIIDLERYTDRELLSQFKVLLPQYREHLSIPEPKDSSKHQINKYLSDIINFKIIPFLDLQLWAVFCFCSSEDVTRHLNQDRKTTTSIFQRWALPYDIPTFTYDELNIFLFEYQKSDDFMRSTFGQRLVPKYIDFDNLDIARTVLNEDSELSNRNCRNIK